MSTTRLGFGNAVAGLIVALLSPFLGALADSGVAKKKMLGFRPDGNRLYRFTFLYQSGDWLNALIVFALACVGYNCAELFYNALLVDVAEKEKMDMVSLWDILWGIWDAVFFLCSMFLWYRNHPCSDLTAQQQLSGLLS